MLTAGGDNWPAVAVNLRKDREIWTQVTRILRREGADRRISWLFFKEVVQAVLVFGSEKWFLTPRMERYLGRFQQRFARRLAGRKLRRRGEGGRR